MKLVFAGYKHFGTQRKYSLVFKESLNGAGLYKVGDICIGELDEKSYDMELTEKTFENDVVFLTFNCPFNYNITTWLQTDFQPEDLIWLQVSKTKKN